MGKYYYEFADSDQNYGLARHFHVLGYLIQTCMISLNDFKLAAFETKCDMITYFSNYLIFRETEGIKSYLYHCNEFFIEVHYSIRHHKVLAINAFSKPEGLDPYLIDVSLNDLIVFG